MCAVPLRMLIAKADFPKIDDSVPFSLTIVWPPQFRSPVHVVGRFDCIMLAIAT